MKSLFRSFLGLSISVLLVACHTKQSTITTPVQELSLLGTPKNHYATLGQLSKAPTKGAESIDSIRFPNKKYELLIKSFQPAYLTREQITALMLELQPPANSSEQTNAELAFLLEVQNKRTKEEEKLALDWNEIVYIPFLGMNNAEHLFFEGTYVMGATCTAENYPATQKLLDNVMKDMRIMEFTAKNHFLRARPRQLSTALKPLVKMSTPSFASGHTLWAYLHAYIWAELIPTKRQAFLDLAYEIGFSREILGVHYPSDEEASRNLSYQMLDSMWKTARFQKDFEAAKAEWK